MNESDFFLKPHITDEGLWLIKLLLLLCFVILLAGCTISDSSYKPQEVKANTLPPGVVVFVDEANHVVCWRTYSYGISCIPQYYLPGDAELRRR